MGKEICFHKIGLIMMPKKKKKKKKKQVTRFLRYVLFSRGMTKTGTADLMKCASKSIFIDETGYVFTVLLSIITLKKKCSQIKRIARKERVLNLLTY